MKKTAHTPRPPSPIVWLEWLTRLTAGLLLSLLICSAASAQSGGMGGSGGMGAGGMGGGSAGGGTMGSGSSSVYGSRSYSNGKAIGIGLGAAAAAVGAIYLIRNHRGSVNGCVTAANDRLAILDEKTGDTYSLRTGGFDIKSGERVELKGKRSTDVTGAHLLEVTKVRDLGACR